MPPPTDKDAAADYDTVWGNRCGVPRLCRMFAEKKGLKAEEVDGVRVFDAVNSQVKNLNRYFFCKLLQTFLCVRVLAVYRVKHPNWQKS